jgi:hypothetical protein
VDGKIFNVGVASDLYYAGTTEDGERYTAELYFVCVEFEGGEVYAHNVTFPGCRVEEPDEGGGPYFIDVRMEAEAKAERLAARVSAAVAAGSTLDGSQWNFHRTIYGSSAYLQEVAEMTPRQRAGEPD